MALSRKLYLLKIVKLIMKIAYSRETRVRKICNFKWRSQLGKDSSIEMILKKTKLILTLCSLPTLRIIAKKVLLNEFNDNEIILIFGDILKRRGQAELSCFNLLMKKYTTIKCKFFLTLNIKFFIHSFILLVFEDGLDAAFLDLILPFNENLQGDNNFFFKMFYIHNFF